jgi:biopolymer transport protein ExbD
MRVGGNSQDFELNLASIIDCFTVLIAFMLATASFLSIGVLDAGVAAAGAESKNGGEPPPVQVSLTLQQDHRIRIEVSGKESRKEALDPAKEGYDLPSLQIRLQAIKGRWPKLEAATLQADPNVEYQEVVRAMEATRRTLPAVLLGGF